jgi:hypothetical protein
MVTRRAALLLGLSIFVVATAFVPDIAAQQPSQLSRLTGTITIESVPAGARILLNGEDVGKTPLRLEGVDPGLYSLRVTREGYRDREEWVRVAAGREEVLEVPLEAARGTLVVRSSLPGIEIRLGSRWIPADTHELPPGNYRFALRAPGYAEGIVPAAIRDGGETVISPELAPLTPSESSPADPVREAGGDAPSPPGWRGDALLLPVPAIGAVGRGGLFVAAGAGGSGGAGGAGAASLVSTMVGGYAPVLSRLTLGAAGVVATETGEERPRFGVRGSALLGPFAPARSVTVGVRLHATYAVPGEEDALSVGLPIILGPFGPGVVAGILPGVATAIDDPLESVPYPTVAGSVGIRRRIVEVTVGGRGDIPSEEDSSLRWESVVEGRVSPGDGNLSLMVAVEADEEREWWAFIGSGIAF